MKMLLMAFLLFQGSQSFGQDFYQVCMKKDQEAGFGPFVDTNLNEGRETKFGNEKECSRLAEAAKQLTLASVYRDLVDLTLLEMFPNLKTISIYRTDKTTTLKIGNHPKLKSFKATGNLNLEDLGDVSNCVNLENLTVFGLAPDSTLDLSQVGRFPKLTRLMLADIKVKNAKAIESLHELTAIGMKRVTLDQSLDWTKFPQLEYKRIE